VVTLIYDTAAVGCRFYDDTEMFDIDLATAYRLGFDYSIIKEFVELRTVGSLLLSSDEVNSGKNAVDISDDELELKRVVSILSSEGYAHALFPWVYEQNPIGKEITGEELKFTNGIALIAISMREEVGEFFTTSRDLLTFIVVETNDALIGVCNLSDGLLAYKPAFSAFMEGQQCFRLTLSYSMLNDFQKAFNCPLSFAKGGFSFTHSDHSTGRIYSTNLVPPLFKLDPRNKDGSEQVGASTLGLSLVDALHDLRSCYSMESFNYYLHLSLGDIMEYYRYS
jgi:hypothetical protein